MDLLTILLICNIALLSVIIVVLFHASMRARKKIPILYEIFIGLIIFMFFLMDSILANWFLETGFFTEDIYFSYRYLLELVLGVIGLYIMVDIDVHAHNKRIIYKAVILIIGTNLFTALLILSILVPSIRDNSIGLLFLFNTNVPLWIQVIIMCSKAFGLGGMIVFLCYISVLVVRSKLFSRWSNIFLVCGLLSIIDCVVSIPAIGLIFNLSPEIIFIVWLVSFVFVLAARINRINIKVMMDIHDLIVTHEGGVPIFSLTDGKIAPDLIGSAMSGVTSLIQEISGSSHKIRAIDQHDIKLLFAFGNHFFITLIIEGESIVLSKMLHRLVHEIEANYSKVLENWMGDVDVFKSLKNIIDSIFSQIEWKTALEQT